MGDLLRRRSVLLDIGRRWRALPPPRTGGQGRAGRRKVGTDFNPTKREGSQSICRQLVHF